VPAGETKSLIKALRACLDGPDELNKKMGEAGHENVFARHNADFEAAKLAKLFSGAIPCSISALEQ